MMSSMRPLVLSIAMGATLFGIASAPATARAEGGPWASASLLGGAARPDANLAEYLWDGGSNLAWGAQGMIGRGIWGAGIRLLQWSISPMAELLGSESSVNLRAVQVLGEVRPLSVFGVQLIGFAGVGRVHATYEQLEMNFGYPGFPEPTRIDLDPSTTWIIGVGGGLERSIGHGLSLGMELERSRFSMGAAHGPGDVILHDRESVTAWNLRARLSLGIGT